jgi:hypothetical protein
MIDHGILIWIEFRTVNGMPTSNLNNLCKKMRVHVTMLVFPSNLNPSINLLHMVRTQVKDILSIGGKYE